MDAVTARYFRDLREDVHAILELLRANVRKPRKKRRKRK
jgi:hypothetical protein